MVTVTGPPSVAVAEAVSVTTLVVPVVVVVCGTNAAVTPVGKPVAVKATVLANPLRRAMVIVLLLPVAPRFIVKAVGFGVRLKSGVAFPTVRVRVAL